MSAIAEAMQPLAHISRAQIDRLQHELASFPQYEPETKHYFHAGMYVREVWRDAGVLVVGKVHKKPHFYIIVSGTVRIDGGPEITGPITMKCEAGTKRVVLSMTPVLCMTLHKTDAATLLEAEAELVEDDANSCYDASNRIKPVVVQYGGGMLK